MLKYGGKKIEQGYINNTCDWIQQDGEQKCFIFLTEEVLPTKQCASYYEKPSSVLIDIRGEQPVCKLCTLHEKSQFCGNLRKPFRPFFFFFVLSFFLFLVFDYMKLWHIMGILNI